MIRRDPPPRRSGRVKKSKAERRERRRSAVARGQEIETSEFAEPESGGIVETMELIGPRRLVSIDRLPRLAEVVDDWEARLLGLCLIVLVGNCLCVNTLC